MAFDAFLKLDGVDGESQASGHEGEIEVASFSFGATQTGTAASGGGGGTGKVSFQDLSFVSAVHKGSPTLLKFCATGEHIKSATLTVRKVAEQAFEFIKLKFEDILVSSYLPAGAAGDERPSEQVSLNFNKIQFSYISQNADGSAGTPNSMGWDLQQNRAT
jgi:type VI secretion system secreted protein Hcp